MFSIFMCIVTTGLVPMVRQGPENGLPGPRTKSEDGRAMTL